MQRLSHFTTPIYKAAARVVPLAVAAYAASAAMYRAFASQPLLVPEVLAPLAVAGVLYLAFRVLVADLADVVMEVNDELILTYGKTKVSVPLVHIMKITESVGVSPSCATLHLSEPSELGSLLSFSPARPGAIGGSPVVKALQARVEAARRSNPSVKGTSCGKPQAAPYLER
jgi:hypothetical protein